MRILKQFNKNSLASNVYSPAIISFGIGAGKFVDSINSKSITDLFSKQTTKNETITSTENTVHWQEEIEEDSNEEDKILEKPIQTTTPSVQGDFFRKFQNNDQQMKISSKSETKTTSSVTSFFSRYTTSNENLPNSSSDEVDDRYMTCSKCQKSILVWDMPEHEDFHYAHELQMEENKTNSIVPAIIKPSKPIKRKNEKEKLKIQTLDSFLNKKPKN